MVNFGAGKELSGASEELLEALLEFGLSFAILLAFFGEDAFDGFLLGDGDVLADVFFGAFVEEEIANQSIIRGEDDEEFVASHADHAEDGFVFGVFVEGCDDVDCEFGFATVESIIEFA
jgi:hypothetical protein